MTVMTEAARLWMLEVLSCDEKLGDDGMCDCCREHFEQLDSLEAERDDYMRQVADLILDADWLEERLKYRARIHFLQARIAKAEAVPERKFIKHAGTMVQPSGGRNAEAPSFNEGRATVLAALAEPTSTAASEESE